MGALFLPRRVRSYKDFMGKKPSKRRKESGAVTHPADTAPLCPYCGITNSEKSAVSFMDQLFRSHAELCAALRLAGRQMSGFEKQGGESLEKIRKVLKRADNIRKVLKMPDETLDGPKKLYDLVVDAPSPFAAYSSEEPMNDGPTRKGAQRKSRLTRPHSQYLLRFPSG